MDGSRSRDEKGKGKEKEDEENSNEEEKKGKMILTEEEKNVIRKEIVLEMMHEGEKECNQIIGKYYGKELHMAINSYINRLAQIEPDHHHSHHQLQLQLQQQEQRARAILDLGNASPRLTTLQSEEMQQDAAKNGEQVDAEKNPPKK